MMTRDRRARTVPGMLLGVVLIGGCESASGAVDEPLSEVVAQVGDTTVVRVAVAPLDIGTTRNHRVTELRSDLDLVPAEVANVIDATSFPDGRMVLLTPENVQVFSSAGRPLAALSRRGPGPGELRYPVAITTVSQSVAVLQMVADRGVISLLDGSTGALLSAREVGRGGDWMSYLMRGPALFLDFPAWSGVEDWSRRLGSSDSSLVVFVQPPEPPPGREDSVVKGPGVLVRLAGPAVAETMAVLDLPPSLVRFAGSEQRREVYWEQLYESRPLWASGPGWLGVIQRGDTTLSVTTAGGRTLWFSWPNRRLEVGEEARTATSRYGVAYVARTSFRSRSWLRQLPRKAQREQYRKFLTFLPFAPWRPQVTALLHAGDCALVAGFDPETYTDGTATAWLRISVRERRVLDVIRVRATDARTLHADGHGIYTRVFGEDDLPHVFRWRFPDDACQAPGARDPLPE